MTSPDALKDDCFEADCGVRGYKFLSYRLAREAVLRDRPGVVAADGSKTPYGVFADFGFHGASWLDRRRETRPLVRYGLGQRQECLRCEEIRPRRTW